MPIELISRAKNAWNAFINNKDPTDVGKYDGGYGYSYRPDRPKFTRGSERSIVNAVYNRIAMDVAAVDIRHVRLDENNRYLETIDSDLNECFATEANIDQTGRSLIQDIVMSMFDEGVVAVIPVDTDRDPTTRSINKIYSMRTAKIVSWKTESIRVRAYNDRSGQYEEIDVLKTNTPIIENPLFAVINEPNSTMQRLIRKLSLLDTVDEQSSAGKLDLIIQLPYTVRSDLRKQQAMERKQAIEDQLANSKYGIAYIDSTEHITQLNRAVENNLMNQIEYLTNMVYSQLGITVEVMNGTADEKTMLNYNNRTIEPILSAIVGEMRRKWLTKTARSQKQSIMFFRDPFKLVPVSSLADIADKFTRNEIMTSNEIRQIVGMKKSDDPNADQLRNKNLNQATADVTQMMPEEYSDEEEETEAEDESDDESQQLYDDAAKDLDDIDSRIDELEASLDEEEDNVRHSLTDEELYGIFESESFEEWLAHYASPYYDPVKAHEYYMQHRELVGRKSTSGLNDEGKEIAAFVKKNITESRKQRLEAARSGMNSFIKALKDKKTADQQSRKEKMNESISQSKAKMKSAIESSNAAKKSNIESLNEETKRKIDRLRSTSNSIKEHHTKSMNNRISSLQMLISKKGKTADQKERIREEIAKLRAANKTKREELTSQFNASRTTVQNEKRGMSEKIRSDASRNNASARETSNQETSRERTQYSSQNKAANDAYKDQTSKLRSDYKTEAANIREETDKAYEDELEKLRNDSQYQKQRKSSGSSKSQRHNPNPKYNKSQ